MHSQFLSLASLLIASCWAKTATPTRVADIIQRSVANTDADWSVAPQFIFTERDVVTKSGTTTTKTWQVSMIEGSPFNKLVVINDEPVALGGCRGTGAETAGRHRTPASGIFPCQGETDCPISKRTQTGSCSHVRDDQGVHF
jgi:hypothetical protein